MARYGLTLCLIIVIITAVCARSSAQSTQPTIPTLPNCPPAQISLSPCIGYVLGIGSSPLTSCCSQLQAFFESQGPCLCTVLKGAPGQLGAVIGQVQAMLPSVCNIPSNACDDVSGTSIVPTVPASPVPTTTTPTTTPPAATPAITPTTPTDPAEPVVPTVPTDVSPATMTTPEQTTPSGVGSDTESGIGSKIPALLGSANAAGRSRNMAAAGVLIPLLVAYVSTMHAS